MTRSSLLSFRLATLLCALALPASGQFNGPGIGTGVPLNQPTSVTSDQALLNPVARDVTLRQGDVLSVRIFGQGEYAAGIVIASDGKVLLPLIGPVALDGLTVTAAEELIAAKLQAAGMFNNPQVTIVITEGANQSVTLVGELHGIVQITGSRRLLDVLSSGGGLPGTASHVITINRPGVAQPIVVDLGTDPSRSSLANIPIFPGDTIVISRIGVVYVIGAFKSQGAVQLTQSTPLTLLEIAALSGGPNFEGKYNDLRIIRTNGEQRTLVRCDMKRVLYGKDPDPILQANDIVFLPSSAIKASLSNGSFSSALSVIGLSLSVFALLEYH